jgi:acyl-homoserine-lactone acylase
MKAIARAALIMILLVLAACGRKETAATTFAGEIDFSSEIRWTSYGIPHVKADDWAGLGYGFAYATARDGVCVIAREVVRVNGEMSRYFGSSEENLPSDIFHKALMQPPQLAAYAESESDKAAAFSKGYVAGYNRYLRDNAGRLPADCEAQEWVRPLAQADVARLAIGVATRYGLGQMIKEIAAAKPPASQLEVAHVTDFDPPQGFGSNAVALGSAVTESGRGILFGNPHYPWEGPARFHMIHTTIPGELDVMGVSLLITPRVVIGFNKDVAWSHTVSTALRSTLYELELNPSNPLQYRYGDEFRDMQVVTARVEEVNAKGDVMSGEHPVYFTHYGPLVRSKTLPWSTEKAYALRDSNLENTRFGQTYDALNKARSVADIEAAISLQGVAWTNTIAADREGNAFYADISVAPNVDAQLLEQCRVRPEGVASRAVVLRGGDPACEWREDARSAIPGILPAQEMPRLRRQDYVANSNDSYWLSNPLAPLEGYSPIIGTEATARSLRTRAGLVFINELLEQGQKFTEADMQAMFYHQRNFGAELLLDDLLSLCAERTDPVLVEGTPVQVEAGCKTLANWDRRMTVTSRGGHLWREFWRTARSIEGVYAVPFDVAAPVATPSGLAITDEKVALALLQSMAGAQLALAAAGIDLDAPLGEIQYKNIGGEHIPVPGGEGWAGMWSMIIADLSPEGYSPIRHGNSYVQVIGWDAAGKVKPQAILTYSQSPEPDAPHSSDMTKLYAAGGWVDLPFTDVEIAADPGLETLRLQE